MAMNEFIRRTNCGARSNSGARCNQPAGHEGNHANLCGSGGFTWPRVEEDLRGRDSGDDIPDEEQTP